MFLQPPSLKVGPKYTGVRETHPVGFDCWHEVEVTIQLSLFNPAPVACVQVDGLRTGWFPQQLGVKQGQFVVLISI